jgi:hypothetical protein
MCISSGDIMQRQERKTTARIILMGFEIESNGTLIKFLGGIMKVYGVFNGRKDYGVISVMAPPTKGCPSVT